MITLADLDLTEADKAIWRAVVMGVAGRHAVNLFLVSQRVDYRDGQVFTLLEQMREETADYKVAVEYPFAMVHGILRASLRACGEAILS